MARGVVCRVGWVGVRVPSAQFLDSVRILLGDEAAERLAGTKWRIHGLPISWGKSAIESCLRHMGWEAIPGRPAYDAKERCRVWIVRAANAPPVQSIDFAEDHPPATINKLQSRPRRRQGGTEVFRWTGNRQGRAGGRTQPSPIQPRTAWVRGPNLQNGLNWNQEQAAPLSQGAVHAVGAGQPGDAEMPGEDDIPLAQLHARQLAMAAHADIHSDGEEVEDAVE